MSEPITDDERPRFLSDEDFNLHIVRGLRRRYPALDLLTLQEARYLGQKDLTVRSLAQELDRLILSHDEHTMPDHYYALMAQLPDGAQMPGLFIVAQTASIGSAIEWIAEIWEASRHHEWHGSVWYLPL
ncbi:MAG: DUF5615 family PIN-like protein [Ktedonobacterales bacterium]